MVNSKKPKGVHTVARKRRDGTIYHFYAWRGGPPFYQSKEKSPNDPEFYLAYAEAMKAPKPARYMTS